MNLFEAIFVRKSVRSYTNEGISPKVLEDILKQFDEINGLFGGVETELAIFDNRQNDYKMLSISCILKWSFTSNRFISKSVFSRYSLISFLS